MSGVADERTNGRSDGGVHDPAHSGGDIGDGAD